MSTTPPSSSEHSRQLIEILDHPLIAQRYFFPQKSMLKNPVYVHATHARLGCWRSAPPKRGPVLVYFHGNGEVVSDWVDVFPPLCQPVGFEVFLAEYRGYGMSSGQPALYSMLNDLEQIAQAIGVPTSRIVVFGRSVGSIYALEWVSRFPDTMGLVIESGIHDVYQRLRLRVEPDELGCTEHLFREAVDTHFNHQSKLSAYQGPSLFMHAQRDTLVTVEHAHANVAAARKGQLKVFARGGHNDILMANTQDYVNTLRSFLTTLRK